MRREIGIPALTARDRIKQVPAVVRRSLAHPSWMAEHVRMARRRVTAPAGAEHYVPIALEPVRSIETALCAAGLNAESAPSEVSIPASPSGSFNDADPALLGLLGAIISLTQPATIIETGVARGSTSAKILSILDANGSGHLYSIDLPTLRPDAKGEVGVLVPKHLRSRWTLRLGPSRRLLPRLITEVSSVDLFVHDSDHSYESQLFEFGQVWGQLARGGFLVADDVNNPAFEKFTSSQNAAAALVRAQLKSGYIGIARKR